MANANEDLVKEGYAAFSAGDMEKLGSLYTDDFVHSVKGDNRFTGDHKGIPAAMGYYGQLFEQSGGTFSVDLKSVKADGDNKVVSVHTNTAEREGKKLDGETTLNFTVKDGKISRIDEVESDQAAYDAFWGKA